jgi:hypothetical protein
LIRDTARVLRLRVLGFLAGYTLPPLPAEEEFRELIG